MELFQSWLMYHDNCQFKSLGRFNIRQIRQRFYQIYVINFTDIHASSISKHQVIYLTSHTFSHDTLFQQLHFQTICIFQSLKILFFYCLFWICFDILQHGHRRNWRNGWGLASLRKVDCSFFLIIIKSLVAFPFRAHSYEHLDLYFFQFT